MVSWIITVACVLLAPGVLIKEAQGGTIYCLPESHGAEQRLRYYKRRLTLLRLSLPLFSLWSVSGSLPT